MLSVLKVPPWVTKEWLDSGDDEEGARAVILKASLPAVSAAASLYVLGQDLSLVGKRDMGLLTSLFSEGLCLDDSVFWGRDRWWGGGTRLVTPMPQMGRPRRRGPGLFDPGTPVLTWPCLALLSVCSTSQAALSHLPLGS